MPNSARRNALPARGESNQSKGETSRRASSLLTAAAVILSVAVALGAIESATAGDASAGRAKAVQCQTCHGLDGFAKIPGAPHLAGQVEEYLAKAVRAYKSGARKDEMMAVVVRQLSEDDIDDLAAYYAGLDPKGGSP